MRTFKFACCLLIALMSGLALAQLPADLQSEIDQQKARNRAYFVAQCAVMQAQGYTGTCAQFVAACENGTGSGCQPAPKPHDCPAGYHWSWAGTGIAHCARTADCPPPQVKVTDANGNESCSGGGPTYCPPPNQAIQCTDPSCSNCPAPPGCVPDGTTSDVLVSSTPCPAGQEGGPINVYNTYNSCGQLIGSHSDGTCTPVCRGRVDTTSRACPPPLTGSETVTTTYDCDNNVIDVKVDSSGCSCPTTSSVDNKTCSDGVTNVSTTTVKNCYGDTVSVTTSGVCPGYCPDGATVSNADGSNCPRCPTGELWTDPTGTNCPCTGQKVSTATGSCSDLNAAWTGTYTITTTKQCDGSSTVTDDSGTACSPACIVTQTTETAACPPYYTGTQSRVRTDNSCTGTSYSSWDITSCQPYPNSRFCPPPNGLVRCISETDCSNCPAAADPCADPTVGGYQDGTGYHECPCGPYNWSYWPGVCGYQQEQFSCDESGSCYTIPGFCYGCSND